MKTKVNRSGRRARSAAAAVISLFSVTGARAVSNFVWTGGVGDGNWNTNANWFNMTTGKTAGTYPGNSSNLSANAVIDDAAFDNTNGYYSGAANLGSGSISIPAAGIELGTISFGDAETNGIYTLSSNLSIGSAGTQIILNGTAGGLARLGSGNDGVVGGGKSGLSYNGTSGVQTILSNLVANNNQSWSINGTSGEILAEGTIANSAGQNIIKSGAGELEIAADNSATLLGGYTAQGGTTLIDNASSLGIGSSVIQIASTTSSNPVSLLTGSGVTFARNIVVVTNNKNETETLGGNSNTSTWTGSIAVNAPVSLTAGSSGTTTFTGIISDGTGGVDDAAKPFNFSNSLITKVGTGTVVLSGSNTYSGGTNISAGVLTGTGSGAFGTGNLTVNPTGGTNTPADAAIVNTTNSIAPGAVVTINTNSNTATGKVNFWGSSETIGGLAGNGTAVLANSSGTSLTIGSAGSTTFSGTISDVNGLGSLNKAGSGKLTLNGSNTYGGGTTISAGILVLASSAALPVNSNLNISSGAVLQLANHGTGPVLVAQVGSLSNGGQIDITNNALVISNGESYQTVWNQIANQSSQAPTGINSASGSIISSAAQNDPSNLTTIGISTGLTSFEGLNISSSAVVVKYTYFGDATLDGQVDGSDYSRIDNGVLLHLTGWQNGDFNYDGVIDGSDYTLIDNAFNTQGTSLASEVADPSATATSQIAGSGPISAVPEPAALGLIGMMSAGLLGRRRRR